LADDSPIPVSLLSFPVFHIAGVANVTLNTAVGGRLVFPSTRFDALEALRLIEEERIRMWGAVSTMAQRAAEVLRDHPIDVSSLQSITLGGAPMPVGLPEKLASAFPSLKRGISNTYGQTETAGTIAIMSGSDDPTCVGKPMPVVEIRIDAPEGPGEVLVRTPSVMMGYWGQTEQPFDESGWLHTGDVGYLDDSGLLHIVDRIKDIIIRGGENISPTAIEEAISRHPSVDEVCVFSVPDADFGEAIAAVIVTDDQRLTAKDLSAYARESLATFEVPHHWWIRSEPLARGGALNKVQRRFLSAEFIRRSESPVESAASE